MKQKKLVFCSICIIFLIGLKLIYKYSEIDDLQFLLEPTSKIVRFMSNSPSVYIENTGYHHESMNIIINKSCSGFNFLILCFAIHIFSIIPFLHTAKQKIYAFFTLLISSYFLTIVINSFRILLTVFLNRIMAAYSFSANGMHQAIGILVYLSFLITIYLTFNYILTQLTFIKLLKKDEKFA